MRHAILIFGAIGCSFACGTPVPGDDAGIDAAAQDVGARDAGPADSPSSDAARVDAGLDAAADAWSMPGADVGTPDGGADAAIVVDVGIDAYASDVGTDAAVVLPPATCQSASVTGGYTPPSGGGTCGYGPVAAHMPAIFTSGHTIAAAELFYGYPAVAGGGSRPEGEGCGECMEITVGDQTSVVMITDVCDPGCCANCPHGAPSIDAAPGPHGELMTATNGSTLGDVRVVPCPIAGNLRVYVDPMTMLGSFMRLMVYAHSIAVRTVEFRGGGPGVSATNPWTPITRSWTNHLDVSGTDPRRGGTGVELRVTSVQGEVLTSATLVQLTDGNDVDLGVQFHDMRASGMVCDYEPLRSIYVDGFSSQVFSGFTAEAWRDWGSYMATVDLASTSGCHAGTCVSVAYSAFGGFQFGTSALIPLADAPRIDFWARVITGTPLLRLIPSVASGTCSPITLPTIGSSWTHVTLDLTTSCPVGSRLQHFQIQSGSATATVFYDDMQLLPP